MTPTLEAESPKSHLGGGLVEWVRIAHVVMVASAHIKHQGHDGELVITYEITDA